jgi:DASS family divalent anion:Na+ symporter
MHLFAKYKNYWLFALCLLVGGVIALFPTPEGVKPEGWILFAIFVATILGVILKPFPMGVVALLGLTAAVTFGALTFTEAFSGFSNDIVWLIVFAFFIARGFISTGLGNRLAYKVMSLLGKNSLGLGYGLVATDFILAPVIPSMTARAGGVIFPILKGLTGVFTGDSHDPRMGAFLTLVTFQGCVITSGMFLTAMAGNPLMAGLLKDFGLEISWLTWFLAAIVPGILSLAIVPYIIYRHSPPTIRQTPHAREMARTKLKEMGRMKSQEWIMLGVFLLLVILWVLGPVIHMKATVAAMIGLSILFVTGIVRWKEALEETGAWDTFIWFATLVTLATFLNQLGVTQWFSQSVVSHVDGMNWVVGFLFISLIYFYSHYFFASNVAHIGAMYTPLLIVSIALGTPPMLAALTLAFFSNLFGGLTHYGAGPAPILFGSGYVTIKEWWKVGALCSFVNIFIWLVIGGAWWKVLGIW